LPLYEYECKKCRRRTERIEKLAGPYLKKCPHCGGSVERVLTASAIQFKGAGWYATDYARKAAPEAAKSEDSAAKESAAPADSKSKEAPAKDKDKKPAKKN
jgi:putative FmdB family regulatory protein